MEGKRSYTVPVLLVIITVMAILLVLVYSKLLLTQQKESKETGERLAERYHHALMFADRLHVGTDMLLRDASAAERLKAKALLGEAAMAGGETVELLTEASSRSAGQSYEEAFKPLSEAMAKIMSEQSGKIYGIAEHDGPLTSAEKDMLTVVRDGAVKLKAQLSAFRPPTGDAGFRNVAAGQGWIAPALEAGKTLIDTASQLK